MKKKYSLLASLMLAVFIISCQKANSSAPTNQTNESTNYTAPKTETDSVKKQPKKTEEKIITYTSWKIKNDKKKRQEFDSLYSKEQRYIIASLNRTDLKHLYKRDSIMVPNEFLNSFLDYSPFPHQMNILKEVKKFVIFSYPIQAFAVYEKGELIKWGPTNMGKKATQTPRGLFFTNWKGRRVTSTVDDSWILNWNFNISNKGGVGWHQYAMPGYPASHSCLRLLEEDAKWLYDWADQWVLKNSTTLLIEGNPVIVYGDYDFSTNGIWHKLEQDPKITHISEDSLNKIIEPHLEKILTKQQQRADYFAEKNQEEATEE